MDLALDAAIDRLVHHSTIIEINTDSYRRRAAAKNAAARNSRPEPKTPHKKPATNKRPDEHLNRST
jgi:hypothetical protein